ncbi:MAG: class I SAM-dependent methyltransferase [Chloroflexi bacterium]|nr:class I SAM-dependent methyltransferase [Chloroflexota bacterium]
MEAHKETERFLTAIDRTIDRVHGRDNPCYAFWTSAHRQALARAHRIASQTEELSGIRLAGARVLDIGCGTGPGVVAFALAGAQAVGLDQQRDGFGLDLAKLRADEHGATVGLIEGDAFRLPFPDEAFDFVFCNQVVEHVPDVPSFLRELHRVMRVGGVAYFATGNRLWPIEGHSGLLFAGWLPRLVAERYVKLRGRRHEHDEWDVYMPTYWSLTRDFRRTGFSVVASYKDLWNEERLPPLGRRLLKALLALRLPLEWVGPMLVFLVRKAG